MDKVRLRYHLYEKGSLLKVGGIKLGDSCILVIEKSFKEILKGIEGFGAHVKTIKVFVEKHSTDVHVST